MYRRIFVLGLGCALLAAGGASYAATPQAPAWPRQWDGSLDRYLAKKASPGGASAVKDRYLGVLDWQGDSAGPQVGRYHAFLIHYAARNGGLSQPFSRAVLADGAGNIVGDVGYPNARLALPALRQADVFGIPQLKR